MTRAITAGIDSSEESRAAQDWAAREAVRRRLPLRLVNSWGLASPLEPIGRPGAESRSSQRLLAEAQAELEAHYPGLEISTESVAEGPVTTLVDAARAAEMLVLGSRGLGRMAGFLLGSVSLVAISHAARPVVVVRTPGNWTEASGREVVVGVKRLAEPDLEVIEFAYQAAAGRGLPLRAVHTPRPGAEDAAESALDQALGPLASAHPDAQIFTNVAAGKTSQALLQAAEDAELIVVGRRGRRPGGLGSPVGPVAQALLHHAACPVAVVPHS